MNAHVLRERSLANNRIFILMPVLTLLVSWCQCFSGATPSSVSVGKISKESANLAVVTHETDINEVDFQTDPKHEISQKLISKNNNENEKLFIRKQTVPNFKRIIFGRHYGRAANDFISWDLFRKRNEFVWQNHLRMKQNTEEFHPNNPNQLLRMMPKTISEPRFKNNSHTHINSVIHALNSNYSNQTISIHKRNAQNHRNDKGLINTLMNLNQICNEHGNVKYCQHKSERSRRESMPKLTWHNPFSFHRIKSQSFSSTNVAGPRRFCTARYPTTLAFEAPTVFEGKVRSMSSDRRKNFSVTFEVKEIYKEQDGLKLPSLVRLKFTYRNSSECDIYRETFRPIGHIKDELEPGRRYILFVNQINLGNFSILGQPTKITRKTASDVRTGVAEKYGQRANIESLTANNATIREGKRLRIVCKVRGRPPPKVTWFKNNRSIAKNRSRYQLIHLRRRSELIIKTAFINDSGQYECRAKNKLARQPIRKFTKIEVLPKEHIRHSNQQINWTHSGSTCPVIGNAFCLNGGTCVFFKDVGEPACKCPDGFLGNRCETKNPTNSHSSTYRNNQEIRQQQHQCGENNFYGSYYC